MIHRDDVPFELAEKMQAHLDQTMPGHRLIFAGDLPEGMFPNLEADFQESTDRAESSYRNGTCLICGLEMPDYHAGKQGWEPPDGWQLMVGVSDRQHCWVCPGCEQEKQEDDPDDFWNGLKGDFE